MLLLLLLLVVQQKLRKLAKQIKKPQMMNDIKLLKASGDTLKRYLFIRLIAQRNLLGLAGKRTRLRNEKS